MPELTDIPVIDLRDGGAPRHVRQSADARARLARRLPQLLSPPGHAARAGARSGLAPLARALALALYAGDRGRSPTRSISRASGCSMRPINGAARRAPARRTACPGCCARSIGRSRVSAVTPKWRICAARSGDFYSVTWPGYVGALTAMAPQRFAACVNQAPMRRRTAHRWLRAYDFAVNAVAIWQSDDLMPPDQLLAPGLRSLRRLRRRAAHAGNGAGGAAGDLLAGRHEANEHCIIERTETGFITREDEASAANDWVPPRDGWEGRIGMRRFLTNSFEEAADYNRAAPRHAEGLGRPAVGAELRLGARAGSQSLYAACGGDVPGARRVAGRRLRQGGRRIAGRAGDAHARDRAASPAAGRREFAAFFANFMELFQRAAAACAHAPEIFESPAGHCVKCSRTVLTITSRSRKPSLNMQA